MKTVIACCLSLFTFSSVASAEVLWRGDFETGDLSQWSGTLLPTKDARQNITVVDSPVFEGTKAGEIVIHPDDLWPGNNHNRVELKYDGQRTAEGETTYFSWYFRLPAHAQEHNDIAYWETDQSWNQTMAFWVQPNDGATQLYFRTNHPSGMTHFDGPVTINEWHQIAMQILWSQDAATGRVNVWLDGTKIVDDVAARTKPDANAVFIQMGYHRNASATPVETIYLDNAIEGTTLEDVLAQAGPDAGTAGSGGTGAGGGGASGGGAGSSGGSSGGTSGSAGSGGTSGGAGSGGNATAGTAGSPPAGGDDESCSCRTAGRPTQAWGWVVALALVAGAFRRRR
jgi:MYXO-CTERM domain-containing protein